MVQQIINYDGSNNSGYSITIWDKQRLIDKQQVKEIMKYQLECKKSKGDWDMHFWAFCGCLYGDHNIYIIDGQHRKSAYDKLKKNGHTLLPIPILVKRVKNMDEVGQSFTVINKAKPLDSVYQKGQISQSDAEIGKSGVYKYKSKSKSKHAGVFSKKDPKSTRAAPKKPKIDEEALICEIATYGFQSVDEVVEKLESFSEECKRKHYDKASDKIKKETKESECYIGLLSRTGSGGWAKSLEKFMKDNGITKYKNSKKENKNATNDKKENKNTTNEINHTNEERKDKEDDKKQR